jgi:hypothetical protein
MGWELWGFFGVEGLDKGIYWNFCGSSEERHTPGAKAPVFNVSIEGQG